MGRSVPRRRPFPRVVPLAMICCLATSSVAGDGEHAESHEPAGLELRKNAIGLVVGGTHETEERETYFTIGVEYTRELSHRWAFNAVAEYLGEVDAWVFVAPVSFRPGSAHVHPKSHFLLSFGPGTEHKGRRVPASGGEAHGEEVEPGENLFLFRTGVRYPVHIRNRHAVVRSVDFDFVREAGKWHEAVVVGLTFAWGF